MLSLGFTSHTRTVGYLYGSVRKRSHSTSILLVNSGTHVSNFTLSRIYQQGENVLQFILSGLTTHCLNVARRKQLSDYGRDNAVLTLIENELAHRQQIE